MVLDGKNASEPDPRRWWALALLCFAFFMVILDANIVIVALPSIEEALSFSEQGLQWVVSAYALTFTGASLLCGLARSSTAPVGSGFSSSTSRSG